MLIKEVVMQDVLFINRYSQFFLKIKESQCSDYKSKDGKHEWVNKIKFGEGFIQCKYCNKAIHFK